MLESHSYYHPFVVHGLLCELSLYILIYTEAANLRHTPELLWFLYWCMNHSYVMHELWKSGVPRVEQGGWSSLPTQWLVMLLDLCSFGRCM